MDREYELIRNRINEIEQQLDDFFSKVNGLEKDEEYKTYALRLID